MSNNKDVAHILFYGETWVKFSNKYKDILRDVIRKAGGDKAFWNQNRSNEILHKIELYKDSPLVQFLDGLNLDVIKNIKTIMYIGRDKDHHPHGIPSSIFNQKFKELDLTSIDSKEIEITVIIEKAPLRRYILDGMEILKIF